MKKLIYAAAALLVIGLTSCSKESKSAFVGWWQIDSGSVTGDITGSSSSTTDEMEEALDDSYIYITEGSADDIYNIKFYDSQDKTMRGPFEATLSGDKLTLTDEAMESILSNVMSSSTSSSASEILKKYADITLSGSGVFTLTTDTSMTGSFSIKYTMGTSLSGTLATVTINSTKTTDPTI